MKLWNFFYFLRRGFLQIPQASLRLGRYESGSERLFEAPHGHNDRRSARETVQSCVRRTAWAADVLGCVRETNFAEITNFRQGICNILWIFQVSSDVDARI